MVSGFKKAARKVEKAADELPDRIEEQLHDGTESLKDEMQRQLRINGSVATGTLVNSLTAIPNPPSGRGFASAEIRGADYWKYVEFGTGRYTGRGYKAPSPMANYGRIMQWVIAQGITPEPGSPYDTQSDVAWAIANSLSTGQQQHKFARPSIRGPRGKRAIRNRIHMAMEYTFARI